MGGRGEGGRPAFTLGGCQAPTFHFRRQDGSFLFRMEEFVSCSPRAKVGKHPGNGGKREMAVDGRTRARGGARQKNSRLKEFKYTLEIKTAYTRTLRPASFPPLTPPTFFILVNFFLGRPRWATVHSSLLIVSCERTTGNLFTLAAVTSFRYSIRGWLTSSTIYRGCGREQFSNDTHCRPHWSGNANVARRDSLLNKSEARVSGATSGGDVTEIVRH